MPTLRKKAPVIVAGTLALALSVPAGIHAEPILTVFHAKAASGAHQHFGRAPSIRSSLSSADPRERAKALESLGKIKTKNPRDPSLAGIRDAVLETLVKGETGARLDAVKALSILKDRGTLPSLLEAALNDSSEAVRVEAKRAIETISRE